MSDISVTGSSGTTVTHDHDLRHPFSTSDTQVARSNGEEQALESHEVIELQTFSERKAWIEQKIKVLYGSLLDGQFTDRHLVPGENAAHRSLRRVGRCARVCPGHPRLAHTRRTKAVDNRARRY